MPEIIIGIPHGDFLYADFIQGLLGLEKKTSFAIVTNRHPGLDFARNNIVHGFLNNFKDAKYLLFLDSDIVPPKDGLIELVESDKDIIGGLYFKKTPPFNPCIYSMNKHGIFEEMKDYEKGNVIEVDGIGCGFLLIKKHVFEKLKEIAPVQTMSMHSFLSEKALERIFSSVKWLKSRIQNILPHRNYLRAYGRGKIER